MAVELNECLISGTVMDTPQITGEGDGAWAFFKIMTSYANKGPDGQWTDVECPIQIVADVPHHVNTIRKYIKAGKALTVSCYYKPWDSNGPQHGFFVRKMIFAKANWGADTNNQQYPMP